MQLVALPLDQYGTFYEGDSYLIYAASEFAKFVGPRTKVAKRVLGVDDGDTIVAPAIRITFASFTNAGIRGTQPFGNPYTLLAGC